MSLQAAAQHLASRGRGPDTHLVHMAPSELAGLQALAKAHGGSLTTNPDTGLPEAGFLSNILPAVLGVAATALTGGAAAPWMIGLGLGGLEAARTGDIGKGLAAGLGAYGGAGLAGGLAGLGTGAISQAAGTGLAEEEAQKAVAQRLADASYADKLSAGAQYAMSNPSSALAGMGGASGLLKTGLAAAAPALIGSESGGAAKDSANPYEYSYDAQTGQYTRQPVGYRDSIAKSIPMFNPRMMADGGAAHLGDYSDGGRLLRGPGDGVSDSIPATIADKRPARLADGEFVVPARIVSELGNGSTEAGARKLYAMMDRVQKARGKTVGKGKVAVNSQADKSLPA